MLIKRLAEILKKSSYTTVLSGFGMLVESDYPVLRDGDEAAEIEAKYGYSSEEIMNTAFYSTRQEQFYEFYRNEILSHIDKPPGKCFYELAKLEEKGLVDMIITRRVFRLSERAGCSKVLNLHGNIYDNYCPHCGRIYPIEYIIQSKRVPLCESCNTPIRPGICLFGEIVDNGLITRAAEEVSKADVLLVLGTRLNTYLCKELLDYYGGDKLVLINPAEHFSDKSADIVIHKRVDEALMEILEELGE